MVPKMSGGEVDVPEMAEEGAAEEKRGDEVEWIAAEEEEECCSDMAAAWERLIPSWRVNLLY